MLMVVNVSCGKLVVVMQVFCLVFVLVLAEVRILSGPR